MVRQPKKSRKLFSLCVTVFDFFFISVQLLDTVGEKKNQTISESGSTTLNATLKVFE